MCGVAEKRFQESLSSLGSPGGSYDVNGEIPADGSNADSVTGFTHAQLPSSNGGRVSKNPSG